MDIVQIVSTIKKFISNNELDQLYEYVKQHNLTIIDNKVIFPDAEYANQQAEYYDLLQYTRKILLNALYGSLLNENCKFFDQRMGRSVTLTGRSIVKHMTCKINLEICGKYEVEGNSIVAGDTDSAPAATNIITDQGNFSIEELFNKCNTKWNNKDKEYALDKNIKVLSYDYKSNKPVYKNINYVYRHKVSKEKWKITDVLGNEVIVTGDHSVMIERDNKLIEIKPRNILKDDIIISISE